MQMELEGGEVILVYLPDSSQYLGRRACVTVDHPDDARRFGNEAAAAQFVKRQGITATVTMYPYNARVA